MTSGWTDGCIAHLEHLFGRNLFWLICSLHVSELGLRSVISASSHILKQISFNSRALIKDLDGDTNSPNQWKGPLMSLLPDLDDLELNQRLKKIASGPEPLELADEVVRDLSHDQHIAYRYYKMIRTGEIVFELFIPNRTVSSI